VSFWRVVEIIVGGGAVLGGLLQRVYADRSNHMAYLGYRQGRPHSQMDSSYLLRPAWPYDALFRADRQVTHTF
jgi:hypothetical protein